MVPHWPAPWGLDADPIHQLIIDDELGTAGVRRPSNPIGIGWAAPTIFLAGTAEQKRALPAADLQRRGGLVPAVLRARCRLRPRRLATRAVRDGDEYVVNGSKIWSSGAHHAQYGILIARTDPDVPKHKGISYFICPMDLPGLTMSPIVDMTTAHSFNQVFFDDVRIPASLRVGDENDGWRLAKVTLSNERVSLSSAGSLWGVGPSADELHRPDPARRRLDDPVLRDRAGPTAHRGRGAPPQPDAQPVSATLQGKTPGPEASIQKIMADEHGQHVMAPRQGSRRDRRHARRIRSRRARSRPTCAAARPRTGSRAAPRPSSRRRPDLALRLPVPPALTLGGGTFAVQRNIVAEHVLGLPREPNVESGLTWAQTRYGSPS